MAVTAYDGLDYLVVALALGRPRRSLGAGFSEPDIAGVSADISPSASLLRHGLHLPGPTSLHTIHEKKRHEPRGSAWGGPKTPDDRR
jgi:hypothetical protein